MMAYSRSGSSYRQAGDNLLEQHNTRRVAEQFKKGKGKKSGWGMSEN
jgi:hypothetical protein